MIKIVAIFIFIFLKCYLEDLTTIPTYDRGEPAVSYK
jgi:hypothetical protein